MPRPSCARYRRMPPPAFESVSIAPRSCAPQSHLSEPRRSPVKHSEKIAREALRMQTRESRLCGRRRVDHDGIMLGPTVRGTERDKLRLLGAFKRHMRARDNLQCADNLIVIGENVLARKLPGGRRPIFGANENRRQEAG